MVISSYGQTFLNLTLIKFPIWPSWTWGDGATVRDHPEMRAETDWLSPDILDVTLACDDQLRCLSWSEGLSLVVLWLERGWEAKGHYQSLSHCAYWSEAIVWLSSTQDSLDKSQARMMPCSTALRMFKDKKRMFLVDQASVSSKSKFKITKFQIQLCQCLFFQNFIFIGLCPKWISSSNFHF